MHGSSEELCYFALFLLDGLTEFLLFALPSFASWCREAERTKATRRSEQQEKVRRHAAASLMKKRGGWMANFGSYMEAALNGVARTVDASMDDDDVAPQVYTPCSST